MASIKIRINNPYSTGYLAKVGDNTLLYRSKLNYQIGQSQGEKHHRVKEDEQLWTIASDRLGDSKYWWVLADVNNILNPFELTPGLELVIPPLDIIKTLI